jgi:ribosomal protein S15P/S13E
MPTKKLEIKTEEKKTKEKISETNKKEEVEKDKKLSQKDFEKKVLELAKTGLTAEKIGENLRKQNIHPKEYDKKISKILKENNSYENPDLINIKNKFQRVKKHSEKNKQDKRAMREKNRLFSQVRKTETYFKKREKSE